MVEILVAVAILVVCVVPLMRAFVMSANFNVKARRNMSATTLSENIMEEIKAAGVEQYGVPSGDFVTIDGKDFPVYTAQYSNYSFDGRNWDIEATMTPSGATYLDGADELPFNSQGIADLSGMDGQTDAVYVEGIDERREFLESYAAMHMGINATALEEGVVTTYRFRLVADTLGDSVELTVTYEDGSGNQLLEENRTVFDTMQNGGRLETLYIFYVPAVRTYSAAAREVVILENLQSLPIDVYLVRQGGSSFPLRLYINEGTLNNPAATRVHTNLDTSLGSLDFERIYRNNVPQTLTSSQSLFGLYGLDYCEDLSARLYEVEVKVTPAGGTDTVSLTGTALP